MALINSRATKRDATPPTGDRVALRDIVRQNHLGQWVVIVPAGQPVPNDLDVKAGEVVGAKKAPPLENKAGSGRPTPKTPK